MQDLELAWETYEFHCASAINKGLDLAKFITTYNKLLDKDTSKFSKSEKRDFRFKIVNCLNKVIETTLVVVNDYKKQNASLNDLIEIYKYHSLHGVAVPVEREIPIRYLAELINNNATLIEHLEAQKKELRNLLP
mgnify:CR=1 FL=1